MAPVGGYHRDSCGTQQSTLQGFKVLCVAPDYLEVISLIVKADRIGFLHQLTKLEVIKWFQTKSDGLIRP